VSQLEILNKTIRQVLAKIHAIGRSSKMKFYLPSNPAKLCKHAAWRLATPIDQKELRAAQQPVKIKAPGRCHPPHKIHPLQPRAEQHNAASGDAWLWGLPVAPGTKLAWPNPPTASVLSARSRALEITTRPQLGTFLSVINRPFMEATNTQTPSHRSNYCMVINR